MYNSLKSLIFELNYTMLQEYMSLYSNLYEILEVEITASMEKIKSAFRKLALIHHPDKNNNSPESQAEFIVINNAYTILCDPIKRQEYDTYLKTSDAYKAYKKESSNVKSVLSGEVISQSSYIEFISNQFNFLLWDIEEILRRTGVIFWNRQKLRHIDGTIWDQKYSGLSLGHYVLKTLKFIDKWVLSPYEKKDSFSQMESTKKADIKNYFYSIRTQMENFIRNVNNNNLIKVVAYNKIRIIDTLFEAQNHTIHYITYINQILAGETDSIPSFQYTNPIFQE